MVYFHDFLWFSIFFRVVSAFWGGLEARNQADLGKWTYWVLLESFFENIYVLFVGGFLSKSKSSPSQAFDYTSLSAANGRFCVQSLNSLEGCLDTLVMEAERMGSSPGGYKGARCFLEAQEGMRKPPCPAPQAETPGGFCFVWCLGLLEGHFY